MTAVPVTLKRSGDRKVSPVIRRQTHKDAVRSLNSFGLPAGDSCPGMTEFCGSCYAASAERYRREIHQLVQHNLSILQECREDVGAMTTELGTMVDAWRAEVAKVGGALVFRIHWDGDFFSVPYTRAWARVIKQRPDVQFWAYTRTFAAVPVLRGIPNLALYVSVDRYNVGEARKVLKRSPGVLAAWCAETQAEALELATACGRTSVPCPENVKRLPLVVACSGKRTDPIAVGDDAQGACVACGLCVYGRRDVGFATKNR